MSVIGSCSPNPALIVAKWWQEMLLVTGKMKSNAIY